MKMLNLSHPGGVGALLDNQLDLTAPSVGVEVRVSVDKTTLWVNVDGVCVLRITQIPQIIFDAPSVPSNPPMQEEAPSARRPRPRIKAKR